MGRREASMHVVAENVMGLNLSTVSGACMHQLVS